jgi:hypothetical protein
MLKDEAWFQERVLVLLYEYNGVTEYACRDKACASFGGLSMSIVETDPVNIRNPFMSVTNTYLASLKKMLLQKREAPSERRGLLRKASSGELRRGSVIVKEKKATEVNFKCSKVFLWVFEGLVGPLNRQVELGRGGVQRVHPALGPADACLQNSENIQRLCLHVVCGIALVVE